MRTLTHAIFGISLLSLLISCGGDAVVPGEPAAVDPCLDYIGQATAEELALTHRADAEAEQLVIEATGLFTAPQDLYNRVSADLANIRTDFPAVSHVTYAPGWDPQSIILTFDETGLADFLTGDYTAWDCPNDLYGVALRRIGSTKSFTLTLTPTVDIPTMVDEYALLPNLTTVEPNYYGGDGPDICLFADGEQLYYVFDDATGPDCSVGCSYHVYTTFVSQPTGEVTEGLPLDPTVYNNMLTFCDTKL